MTSIEFTYPWLLLVAIPLIGLSLIPYFKVGKKYRRTRNRIVSLVLHCLSIVLVTFALAGVSFVHSTSNAANELIILVDVSNTQNEAAENRDNFIGWLLRENAYQGFTVGVVTFGLDQVYAVPLTRDTNSVFDDYLEAELPDTSATDIESALEYARTLFNHPESGKIVLITDGKETDGNVMASASIGAIAAQGTRLDTVYVSSAYGEKEYQVLDVKTPEVQVKKGVECTLEAIVYTNNEGYARINLYDNGKHVEIGRGDDKTDNDDDKTDNYIVHLKSGTQSVALPYAFKEDGFHELKVSIEPVAEDGASDTMAVNNTYFTYYNIQPHKKVLVFEAFEGESQRLTEILNDTSLLGEGEEYDVSIFNLQSNVLNRYVDGDFEEGSVPRSVDDLRQYDQVILNNIANKDLIENTDGTLREIPLDQLLYSYVYEYGGGMLTVGGKDPSDPTEKTAHAYNRRDMYGTDYQKMLPVEAVNYTPPVGVFIIVDVSGSMSGDSAVMDGKEKLEWAVDGAWACAKALSERDKIGILTLGNNYDEILPLTPKTEEKKIEDGIKSIGPANSGTQFEPSVKYAAEQLRAAQMEKNHIIIVSDCEVGEDDMGETLDFVRKSYLDARLNLTVSVVNIGGQGDIASTQELVLATREDGWKIDGDVGCGYYTLTNSDVDMITHYMSADVKVPLISEINYEPFQPIIRNELSQVVQGIDRGEGGNTVNATLNGYFGVKKKNLEAVDLVLTGNYQVPIYARWDFGKGRVGSFMCDLTGGKWSGDFMSVTTETEEGKTGSAGIRLIYNIIDDLMPITDIRPKEINLTLSEKNYSNHLTCPTELADGESVRGTITAPDGTVISLNQAEEGDGYVVKRPLSESNRYSVCDFQITKGGIYTITIQKVDAEGNVLASASVVKEFSYSKEYDVEYDKTEEEVRALLGIISENGKGAAFDATVDAGQIFREFQTELSKVFDPRLLLIILAVVLFLLDVAVRKFKFKWLHEIIREKKQKAQGGQIRKEEQNEENH